MRPSNYNIYVKLKNNSQFTFVIQGYTGAIDLINNQIVEELQNSKSNFTENIDANTYEALIKRGYLTEMSLEDEIVYVKNLARLIHIKQSETYSFLFAITKNCNFRCIYCYENKVSYNGKSWSKSTFSKELVDKAYNAIIELQPDKSKHKNIITLYGGEPLLKQNLEIVQYIIFKGIEKGYTFKAITNGYDLDAFIQLLGKGKLERLQITLDGLEQNHNSRRKHFENNDSFSKLVENIELALHKEVFVNLRSNIDESNLEDIEKLMDLFEKKGWLKLNNFKYSVAQTHYESKCKSSNIHGLDKIDLIDRLIELLERKQYSKPFLIQDGFIGDLIFSAINNNVWLPQKGSYCGAHTGMYILDPDGDIYTCWDKFGDKNFVVANYLNSLNIDFDNHNKWRNRYVSNIESCSRCKFALICAGGCAGLLKTEDLNKPNCMRFPNVFSKIVNYIYDKNSISLF